MIHIDHQSLRHLKSKDKLNRRHVIKYKQSKKNIVWDALSWKHVLLNTLNTKLLGYDYVKELYLDDIDFSETYFQCEHATTNGFFRHDGFLFKDKKIIRV